MSNKAITITGLKGVIQFRRLAAGYPQITAENETDLFFGLGYAHAYDRQMQMWLLKVIGEGRASECLAGSQDLVAADRYLRWLDLVGDARGEATRLPEGLAIFLETYCRGANQALAQRGRCAEFRLMNYQPEPWTPADCLLLAKMIGFLGLAQLQGDMEKFILQLIRQGIDTARLKELFPNIREDITPQLVDLIKQVHLAAPILPEELPWQRLVPSLRASNNWAIRPERSSSGQALLCGDPHLALQLPAIWYVSSLRSGDYYLAGASIPGVPAVAIGRSPYLAWSATYAVADSSDYFIEQIKDGHYRRGDEWLPLQVREELLRPKKGELQTLRVFSSEHGLIEGEVDGDGYYLAYAWSGKQQPDTAIQSLDSFTRIFKATSVEEALEYFAGLTFADFNWVMADRQGNIGYQMGGLIPKKAPGTSGLLPYLGWEDAQAWNGMHDPTLNPRAINPPQGYLITANDDLNYLGQVQPIKLPMSDYRARRIRSLIEAKDQLSVEDMQHIHYDRYSLQAETFMEIIRPLLPYNENGEVLRGWDLCYEADSTGATLFERVYSELLNMIFGEGGFGKSVLEYVRKDTPLFAMLHANFDRILLSDNSVWFGGKPREALYRIAVDRGLIGKVKRYGTSQSLVAQNLFFGGKLPRILGFDANLAFTGSRATVFQGQLFRSAGRDTSFAPTYHMICEMDEDRLYFNIAGGASDRRTSRYYKSGLGEWVRGIYFLIEPLV